MVRPPRIHDWRAGALLCALCVACGTGIGAKRPASAGAPSSPAASGAGDISNARLLDHQGVLAYEAGRYNDAIRYFDAALAHGGPPSERWNVARCLLKLDEAERADQALAAYVVSPGLSTQDRRDANAALEELRGRLSTLTVVSTPSGAPVLVDGRHVGVTPLATSVAPGAHTVLVVSHDEQRIEARFGRPVIVEVPPP